MLYSLYYTLCAYLDFLLFVPGTTMPRRPRPVSRRPPKNFISAQGILKSRPLPPNSVVKLESLVEISSGLSSEEDDNEESDLEVIEKGSDSNDNEEDAGTPRVSQWVDDDEVSYKHANDEPVRISAIAMNVSNIHVETS